MRRMFVVSLLLLLAGCVSGGPLSGKYGGADAGYLIVAITARSDTSYNSYTLRFRKQDRSAEAGIWWGQQNMFDRRRPDIEGVASGVVDVRRLPPGDYEIFNFKVFFNGGSIERSWSSKQDFSIPFTIAPGRATYVGDFMAAKLTGKNIFGLTLPDGAYFVWSDKGDRDLPIAKEKEPGLGEMTRAVIDPMALANPLISARVY